MATEWHYSKGGQQHGPVSAADLKALTKSGELLPTDMIWKEGMAEWKPAGSLKGLFPPIAAPAPQKAPPPLPTSSSVKSSGIDVVQPAVVEVARSTGKKILADRLLLLSCCLGLSIVLTGIIPSIIAPKRLSTFHSDILAEPGFENVKDNWNDPRIEAEVQRRERENTRNEGREQTSQMAMRFFVLSDIALAGMIGFLVFRRYTKSPLDARYDISPPPLPFSSPWNDEERSVANQPETIRRLVACGLGLLLALFLVVSIFQPEAFGAVILVLPMGFLLLFGPLNRSFLNARWVPVEGNGGWIQLASSGSFSREDGTSASFRLLKNFHFIDVWQNGTIIDCFKIQSRTHTHLELQHRDGKAVKYKRSMTAGEALVLNPLALLEDTNEDKHRRRLGLLQEKWEPINGDGPAIQFTDDIGNGDVGAYIRFDGFAARYSLSTKPPFDTITIRYGQETISLTILSLERDELVLNGDGVNVHYKRGVSISAAEARRRADAFNDKVKTVGKAALVTAGAIGAGIAVLGMAAVAGAAGSGGGGAGSGDANSGLVRCKACGGQGVNRYSQDMGTKMAEFRCSVCDGKGWIKQ